MEYLVLGLLVFGGWFALMGTLYWIIAKKVLRSTDELTLEQRLEFLKTRRQRDLKR